MKINARPLKGEAFDIEAEPGETVEALKAKVEALHPELPAGQQKLVFAGRVLQDSATLADSGVKDGDFLVIMVAKPKAAASEPAAPSAPAPSAPSAPTPSAPSAPTAASAEAMAAAGMAAGPALDSTIQMMCDMGFPRSDVERCLRAAFGNADRAVEYLMSGIPPHLMQQAAGVVPPAPAPAPAPAAHHGHAAAHPHGHGGQAGFPGFPQMPMAPVGNATGPLAKLQNHPLFFRLRAAVQQNPQALNQVLSVINQADPSLITLIAEHQEEFVELLQEPIAPGLLGAGGGGGGAAPSHAPAPGAAMPAQGGLPQDPVAAMIAAMQAAAAAQAGGAAAPAPAPAPAAAPAAVPAAAPGGGGAPALTPQDEQALERLQALGFDRDAVVQAFLACDRNEELAANYLFDQAEEN